MRRGGSWFSQARLPPRSRALRAWRESCSVGRPLNPDAASNGHRRVLLPVELAAARLGSSAAPLLVEERHARAVALVPDLRHPGRIARSPRGPDSQPVMTQSMPPRSCIALSANRDPSSGSADRKRTFAAVAPVMSVAMLNTPVMPNGWPRAISPPWTFTRSGSMPKARWLTMTWTARVEPVPPGLGLALVSRHLDDDTDSSGSQAPCRLGKVAVEADSETDLAERIRGAGGQGLSGQESEVLTGGLVEMSLPVGRTQSAVRVEKQRRVVDGTAQRLCDAARGEPCPAARAASPRDRTRSPSRGHAVVAASSTRVRGSYPLDHSSGSTTRSQPRRPSSAVTSRATARLPVRSPGVASHWATPMTAVFSTVAPAQGEPESAPRAATRGATQSEAGADCA
jgi:hypothetical protein